MINETNKQTNKHIHTQSTLLDELSVMSYSYLIPYASIKRVQEDIPYQTATHASPTTPLKISIQASAACDERDLT